MADALRTAIAKRSVPTRRAKAGLAERDSLVLFFTFATPVRVGWIAPETISCALLACQTANACNFRFTNERHLVCFFTNICRIQIDFALKVVDECAPTLVLNAHDSPSLRPQRIFCVTLVSLNPDPTSLLRHVPCLDCSTGQLRPRGNRTLSLLLRAVVCEQMKRN